MRRILLWCVAVAWLSGCPKPGPGPVGPTPDASDAAVTHVSCDVACQHVAKVPGGADYATCFGVCAPIQNPAFADCINAASTKAKITACGKP